MADIRINSLPSTATSTASDDFIAIDGSANGTRKLSAYSPTFGGNFQANGTGTIGGNLTVSGTGTSSVAGNWAIGTTSSAWPSTWKAVDIGSYSAFLDNNFNKATDIWNNAYYNGTISIYKTSAYAAAYRLTANSGDHEWYVAPSGVAGGTVSFSSAMVLKNSGNLLLKSDGVDSSNGKLQLATHTTSAGGIGFGTDVSLWRSAAGTLFTNAATFTLPSTGDLRWDGGGYVTIGASSSLVFRNLSAATILTLDGSSQNATFAGTVQNTGQRIMRGTSSNTATSSIPVVAEFTKSSGDVATTTASVTITATLGGTDQWREGVVEVYAAHSNVYSGQEGAINELVRFQDVNTFNPRNFTVVRTSSSGQTITLTYTGTADNTFTINASCTDAQVPGSVPNHELWMTAKVIFPTAVSLS